MKANKTYAMASAQDADALWRELRVLPCVAAFQVPGDGVYVELTTPVYQPRSEDAPEGTRFDDDPAMWADLDGRAARLGWRSRGTRR
jgi:hypothetical protein